MDKTKSLIETKYNNYTKYDQRGTIHNLNNLKIRRDASEPNKLPYNKEIDKNYGPKSNQNYRKYSIQADCGDTVINKIEQDDDAKTAKDNPYKINKEIDSDENYLTLDVNLLPEQKCEQAKTKIYRIVKQNIDLQNTNANSMINAKYGNKTTKYKVQTKGNEANKRKPIDSKVNNREVSIKENSVKPVTSHKNVIEEKSPKSVATDGKAKKSSKVPLVVKIPKSVNKVQMNESVESNNSKNSAQLRTASDTSKRKGPDQNRLPFMNKCLNKNEKEFNFINEHGQKKVPNYFQMYHWTRNTKAIQSYQNKNSLKPVQSTPSGDVTKKTKLNKSYNKKKDGSSSSFRKGKLALKQNSKMDRKLCKAPTASSDRTVRVCSPPTEVAKWAPNSVDKHTKLYYEAWVNTTPTAVSKGEAKIEPEKEMKNFQKYMQEQSSVMYKDYNDKRFVGTIKVNHRRKL